MTLKTPSNISVIGAGSWGTALAVLLAKKGYNVALWGYKEGHINNLVKDRENKRFLKGITLPENIFPVSDLHCCFSEGTNVVVMVVPSHSYRSVFEMICPYLRDEMCIISAVKGIENQSLLTMTQLMTSILSAQKNDKKVHLGVLSGPSFAEEVAKDIPTAVTIGFSDIETARNIQNMFVTDTFRVYASDDVIGLEISAALKNIIAIATGICDGLGYGLNTRAALITRGLAEIKRFGRSLGAKKDTFSGLSGMGDLLLTCTGSLSRNRKVGLELGKGRQLDVIIEEMNMVAEGVKTTRSVYKLAKKINIEMPITEQVYFILYANKNCLTAVQDLLKRELKIE